MAALAELIKEAAPEPDATTSKFLGRLNDLETKADAPSSAANDLSRMTGDLGLPTVHQEMWQNTLRTLAKAGLSAAQFGTLLRAMRARSEDQNREQLMDDMSIYEGDVPGRGVRAPLASKSAGLALPLLAATAGTSVGSRLIGGNISNAGGAVKDKLGDLKDHLFAQTGKATDNPWFYPLMLATVLGSGYSGYKDLDTQLNTARESRSTRAIADAKAEFERALSTQYQQAQMAQESGVKISSHHAGVVVDGLARAHISGELYEQLATLEKAAIEAGAEKAPEADTPSLDGVPEKKAPWTLGAGNKALGIYLATLALLAAAGAGAGYHGVKAYETPRRKHDVAKELLRRRSLGTPPIVTTEA